MPAGLQVINNAGSILIDESYANLALKTKGSATTVPVSQNTVSVALSGLVTPMIALASPVRFATVKHFASDFSSMLFKGEAPGSATVEYYIFDMPTSSGVNGLQVFNASGVLVFDSGNKYARVVDIFGGANLSDWTPARTYAAGRTYAVVELKKAYQKASENLGGGSWKATWYTSAMKVVDNVVTGKMIVYKEDTVGAAPTGIITDNSAQFAVLDVTGY